MVITNPHARPAAATAVAAREKENGAPQAPQQAQARNMGPQSQRRLTMNDRTHQMQASSHRKKRTGQQTLFGEQAFNPAKHCAKCRGGKSSHKAHHELCYNKKRGVSTAAFKEEKRLKLLFEAPLTEEEKCSGKYLTKEATKAFFAPRENAATASSVATSVPTQFTKAAATSARDVTAADLCKGVTNLANDSNFAKFHTSS